jgi:pimeloyl-ACP methyl ester carboxylesterase
MSSTRVSSHDVVEEHRAAGRRFEAAGVASFVREAGPSADGEPVVCLHGVPASCFLYRKVLHELAARGLRGIAFDLPGLGLADRPATFDYTWTGLGRFCAAAVDALGLDRFHLVVHDIGGPVGFELAAAMPGRVVSRYPVQVIWGASDSTLKLTVEGEAARRAAGADKIHTVPAKHFLQEDQAPAVAEHIARMVTA